MPINLFDISTFQDAVVTVMGLGRFKQGSGIGAAKWLMRHGAQLVITDLKTQEEMRESIDEISHWYDAYRSQFPDRTIYHPLFVLAEHRAEDFTDVDLVVQNPGVPRESEFVQLAREHRVPIESDMSLFFRYCPFSIYAITGTRGKSTTTALLGEMFKGIHPKTVVAGNISRSPLEDLDWLLEEKSPVPVVLELSSWQIESLENIDRAPEIAILTNIFPDHLNRYASLEAYAQAKMQLFRHCKEGQYAVLNADHEMVRVLSDQIACKKYWFSETETDTTPTDAKALVGKKVAKNIGLPRSSEFLGTFVPSVFLRDGQIVCSVEGKEHVLGDTATMALKGTHNLLNALAASLSAHLAGVPAEAISAALKSFQGLPGRQEIVKEVRGVAYVNDTTATSPDGVIAALDRFGAGKQIVLITGGTTKGLPYGSMGEKVAESCKYVVYLAGNATPDIQAAVGQTIPSVVVKSMDEAVKLASKQATEGDTVLMSPGATSFEMFKNEFDRGEQFVEAVQKVKE